MFASESWTKLGEGKANIIYISPCDSQIALRVSKRGVNPEEVLKNWRDVAGDLEKYQPNMQIKDSEEGPVLSMHRIGAPPNQLLGQLKPKWLLQSPDAPKDAVQCRTCALRMLRKTKDRDWCPLDLAELENIEEILMKENFSDVRDCARLLREIDLIPKLRNLQKYNETSSFRNSSSTGKLLKLMSLRDCSIMFEGSPHGANVYIVDLDPKDKNKIQKWQSIETELTPFYKIRSSVCRLSR